VKEVDEGSHQLLRKKETLQKELRELRVEKGKSARREEEV
jgi:hypothetical protein